MSLKHLYIVYYDTALVRMLISFAIICDFVLVLLCIICKTDYGSQRGAPGKRGNRRETNSSDSWWATIVSYLFISVSVYYIFINEFYLIMIMVCICPYRADNNTLESYKVEPGSTLHMVLSLRGGANNNA